MVIYILCRRGTRAIEVAIDKPTNKYVNDPKTLTRATTIPMAIDLRKPDLFSTKSMNFSNTGDISIARLILNGRRKLFTAHKPAYTARNPRHCPGANGEIFAVFPNIIHDIITRVIELKFDTKPYDNATFNPNFTKFSFVKSFFSLTKVIILSNGFTGTELLYSASIEELDISVKFIRDGILLSLLLLCCRIGRLFSDSKSGVEERCFKEYLRIFIDRNGFNIELTRQDRKIYAFVDRNR